jgi:hypothetical protein
MKNIRWALAVLFLTSSMSLYAQNADEAQRAVELAVSNQALQLRYLDDAEVIGRAESDLAYSLLLTEDRDIVGSAALFVDTDLQFMPRLTIQIAPQAYAALLDEEDNDVFALAFGVKIRYDVVRARGIAIVGHAFYSPDVLTFGTADNMRDFEARGEIRLTERLIGFAGYRWFRLSLTGTQEEDLQNQFFAGLRVPL